MTIFPSQREKLAILVSIGKSKEAIGVQLTHEQVKRLSDKDVEKYYKRLTELIRKAIKNLPDIKRITENLKYIYTQDGAYDT